MNDNETTPVIFETVTETFCDLINCERMDENDKTPEERSEWLIRQYENSTKDKQEAMDVICTVFTGKTFKAIFAINKKRNETNQNVG